MTLQLSVITPKVSINNGKAVTTSRDVADYFGKLHKDVLKKIESLGCSPNFTKRNFTLSDYSDSSGRKLPMFEMTKDGFVFLVMGFTGKRAAEFKEAYISEFNQMEAQLHDAIITSGCTRKILLTFRDKNLVNARVLETDEHVATMETLFEMARRADYFVIHKDELLKKLTS